MLDPDNKIDANSTWEALPRRQLLLKFLASLVLFGFLVGLMLGQLLQPNKPIMPSNTVEQLLTYADGLSVCLREPGQVQASHVQGTYHLWFADTAGREARGVLVLANGERITWRLTPHGRHMQVVFIGLQPLIGQWHVRVTPEHWCAEVQINSLAQVAPL
jgi:hypothetical protein